MFLDDLREFCLSRKGATEHFPFDQNTLVFKVGNKMFALMDVEHFEGIDSNSNFDVKYTDLNPSFNFGNFIKLIENGEYTQ